MAPGGLYLVPPAAYWPDRDVIMITTHVDLVSGLVRASKRAPFGPNMPLLETPEIIGGPDLVPTAADWSA